MPFSSIEISSYGGQPTLLFEFTRDTKVWRYTAADRDVVFGGNTFKAVPISCGEIAQTGDSQTDEVTIIMPANEGMPALFVEVPPVDRIRARVLRFHRDDSDFGIRYVGYVDRVRRITPLRAEVKCKTLDATLRRSGARLTWQRSCPHVLYGSGCGVNKAGYAVAGTVSSLTGATLSASALAAFAAGYFTGGLIEWIVETDVRMWRTITSHDGSSATLLGGTYGLDVGMNFTVYPGCNRTAEECNDRFNNLSRFGGIRHLPQRSPFDGNPVF